MSSGFWWVAAGHHVVVAVVTVLLARLWARRAASGPRAGNPLFGLAGVLGVVSAAAATSAWVASSALPDRVFALSRLVSQVVFGEVLVLLAWAAVWLALQRTRAASLVTSAAALLLLGVYVEAYHLEPRRLVVQRHEVACGRADETAHDRPSFRHPGVEGRGVRTTCAARSHA